MPKQISSTYWRTRCKQTRTLAEATTEEDFRQLLLDIANEYDKLAENTEMQERSPLRDAAD